MPPRRRVLAAASLAAFVPMLFGCTGSMVRRHGGPFEDPARLCVVDPNDPPPPPLRPRVPSRTIQDYKGYEGAYRGRVVDADTGAPLAGAAVAAVWHRQVVQLFGSVSYFYAACEVLTDANGDFVLDPKRIERHAPNNVGAPQLFIYFPGYNSVPGPVGSDIPRPASVVGEYLEGTAVVCLPKMKSREDRMRVLGSFHLLVPAKYVSNVIRLVNVERVSLGLGELHPKEGS